MIVRQTFPNFPRWTPSELSNQNSNPATNWFRKCTRMRCVRWPTVRELMRAMRLLGQEPSGGGSNQYSAIFLRAVGLLLRWWRQNRNSVSNPQCSMGVLGGGAQFEAVLVLRCCVVVLPLRHTHLRHLRRRRRRRLLLEGDTGRYGSRSMRHLPLYLVAFAAALVLLAVP